MSKENRDLVKSIIEDKFKMPRTLDLYKEFIGKTEIERYKLEDFTVREIVRGTSISQIVRLLKEKIPDAKFSRIDVEKFIERSDELHSLISKDKTSLAKRWLKAKSDLTEELAQLAAYTKGLIPKLQEQDDNTNTIRAIATFQNILMNYATLEGVTKKGTQVNTQVNINMDKLEQLRERAHRADFVVNVDDDQVSTTPEPESSDEKSDSE